uniref:Uncharacterized protein n=1 Tax=Ananas comosus var. bracteatus TaxID=296719 RepID=A0A6V7QPD0_ANACO|nr:unnamed protein product [Ananas comosus var. bracteatus]
MMLCRGFSKIEVRCPLLESLEPRHRALDPRLQTFDWLGNFPFSGTVDSFAASLAYSRVWLLEDVLVEPDYDSFRVWLSEDDLVEPHNDGSLNLLMCILEANRLVTNNVFMQLVSVLISCQSIQDFPSYFMSKGGFSRGGY